MQRLLLAFGTILAFAAGFGVRSWMARGKALPAPTTMGAEFTPKAAEGSRGRMRMSREELISQIEANQSIIEKYRAALEAMDRDFDNGLVRILNPSQLEKFHRQRTEREERGKAFALRLKEKSEPPPPLTEEQIAERRVDPLSNVLRMIQPTDRAKLLTENFGLDGPQQEKVLALLRTRRDKFLELVDATPSPSVRNSTLALFVERLKDPSIPAEPAKKESSGKPPEKKP